MYQLQLVGHERIVAEPQDGRHHLVGLAPGKLPFLPHVVGHTGLRADYQHQAVAGRDSVADLLMERQVPRGHGNAVEPNIEALLRKVIVQPPHECLIVAARVGQEDARGRACL